MNPVNRVHVVEKKIDLQQELVNRIKIARTLIRLKHSIAADNELKEKLGPAKKAFWKKVQQGQLPERINLDALKTFDV